MFTVRVEKTAKQEIDFDKRVGISTTGDVIIEDWNGALCKFNLQQDGLYRKRWRRHLPENFSSAVQGYRKYLTETGDLIMQNLQENNTTFLLDQEMKLKDSWQHKRKLTVIGCLPGPRTVYAVNERLGNLVAIRSQNGELIQLKSKRIAWNSCYMSVCEDGRTGKLVAVQYEGREDSGTMDIFSGDGKTKHRIHHQIVMQV